MTDPGAHAPTAGVGIDREVILKKTSRDRPQPKSMRSPDDRPNLVIHTHAFRISDCKLRWRKATQNQTPRLPPTRNHRSEQLTRALIKTAYVLLQRRRCRYNDLR